MYAFRDPAGGLQVTVRALNPYAEVTAVHPDEEKLVIEGFFAFGDAPAEAELTAVRRKTGERVTGETTITADRWHAELPHSGFAAEPDRGFWDLRLGGLELATWVDDVPQKKNKIRYPARYVPRDGDHVRVRAYYTDHDHLAIASTVVAEVEGP